MFKSPFTTTLEKATSHLRLEPDWEAIIQLTDMIRQGDVGPKLALCAIKKRFYSSNVHVSLFALLVLEACMKNCGSTFHMEVANKEFMEELHELIKNTTNPPVLQKLLELIQAWAHAFRYQPNFRAVQDLMNLLRAEGHHFPRLKESDAMFVSSVAPEWSDGECCNRCRVQFSFMERKHHCRNCGQIFCNKCSSRQSTIVHYGIEKEVRVCEDCYKKLHSNTAKTSVTSAIESSTPETTSTSTPDTSSKSAEELREEEELQLAIALSKSEAEHEQSTRGYDYNDKVTESSDKREDTQEFSTVKLDPMLSRYMDREYWERRQQQNNEPSAPFSATLARQALASSAPAPSPSPSQQSEADSVNGVADNVEQFRVALQSECEMFVNRINSNRSRNRPIENDSGVHSLFINITNQHATLINHLQRLERERAQLEMQQDKLNQVKDARAALDALREEHSERLRKEAEEADRQRQQQLAIKLDAMRKKKQESRHYQNQLTLQRLKQHEMGFTSQSYASGPTTWSAAQPVPGQIHGYSTPAATVLPQVYPEQPHNVLPSEPSHAYSQSTYNGTNVYPSVAYVPPTYNNVTHLPQNYTAPSPAHQTVPVMVSTGSNAIPNSVVSTAQPIIAPVGHPAPAHLTTAQRTPVTMTPQMAPNLQAATQYVPPQPTMPMAHPSMFIRQVGPIPENYYTAMQDNEHLRLQMGQPMFNTAYNMSNLAEALPGMQVQQAVQPPTQPEPQTKVEEEPLISFD